MLKTPLFKTVFFLILLIAVLHITALIFHFYWELEHFDKLMHFLGGFWIALVTLWFLFLSGFVKHPWLKKRGLRFFLLTAFLSSLSVGVAWEVFELWGMITFIDDPGYWEDTILDIVFDVIGGLVAGLYVFGIYNRHRAHFDHLKNVR